MKAPAFWTADHSALAQFLRPAAALYGAIAAHRMARPGVRVKIPVIVVGNFVAGGAGKTPTALALARDLTARGETPAFVSRGYGGSHSAPLRVADQSAALAGDEPLLLARVAPTFVGVDRVAAARLAIDSVSPSLLILDDGLQSRRVEPDIAIAVVDAQTGAGNGLSLPAGPLRAPLAGQMRHVQAVLIVGDGVAGEKIANDARSAGVPVFRARIEAEAAANALAGQNVVAFAGIARPEKFFQAVEKLGVKIVARRAFGDHHRYTAAEIEDLRETARANHALLVTTEKDFVRLPPLAGDAPRPQALAIRMIAEPAFDEFIAARLAKIRAG